MKLTIKRKSQQAFCSLLLPFLLAQVGVAQTTKTAAIAPPQVPQNLRVPTGQTPLLQGRAKGVQIYECKNKADNPNQFEWKLKAPDANLFNDQGQKIIKHYAGPTWEANDGSKVVGQVQATANSPQDNAIPWLLLEAKSHQGNGTLSKVTYIQRVKTVGGKAPTQGCNPAHANTTVKINYTADYVFWTRNQ
jgi:hypothetical protein